MLIISKKHVVFFDYINKISDENIFDKIYYSTYLSPPEECEEFKAILLHISKTQKKAGLYYKFESTPNRQNTRFYITIINFVLLFKILMLISLPVLIITFFLIN